MMNSVLAFGEIVWDIIEGEAHLGGAPFNFAAHTVQCGAGATLISAVGNDNLGRRAIKLADAMGVDTSGIQTLDHALTGTVSVSLIEGQPAYEIVTNVAYDFISFDKTVDLNHEKYDAFYFGTLIQRNEVSRNALYEIINNHHFDHVFYDVNLRKDCYQQDWIEYSLHYCSILKINEEELKELSSMLFNESLDRNAFLRKIKIAYKNILVVIVTAGSEGSYINCNEGLFHLPSEKIIVADTVGAGDSFSAAFLTNYIHTKDAIQSAKIATKVGAYVASSRGAVPQYSASLKEALKIK